METGASPAPGVPCESQRQLCTCWSWNLKARVTAVLRQGVIRLARYQPSTDQEVMTEAVHRTAGRPVETPDVPKVGVHPLADGGCGPSCTANAA